MTNRFEARKQKILEQLNVPDSEYHDLSPKGSVDEPIRDLISDINGLEGFVTTSSCSGRMSVYLEGNKADSDSTISTSENQEARAGPGGKGGGAWLFISHTPLEVSDADGTSDYMSMCGLDSTASKEATIPPVTCRYIHLKFEPMVSQINFYTIIL